MAYRRTAGSPVSPRASASSSVLGTWALTVVRALEARGFAGRALAVRAGIEPATLEDPNARHPLAATTELWRLAVEVTGDPCFGLWASRFVTQTTFHALGFAVFASSTLQDAFERFVRYRRLISDVAEVELRHAGAYEHFCLVLPTGQGRPADEAIDAIFALVTRTARMLSSGKVSPVAVRLERPEPLPSEPFRKVFRVPVQFAQGENVLEYAGADFGERLPAANTELARHNDEVVARYLDWIERARVSCRLRGWLIDRLSSGEPSEEMAARALGFSTRNLQRRLHEEGTTYRNALNRTRLWMARDYLGEGRASITEIALLLGFTDTGSFSRAFRRWTGLSPRAYCRDQCRGRAS